MSSVDVDVLTGLLDRVQAAEGPDRLLDAEVCIALSDFPQINVSWTGGPFRTDLDEGWRVQGRNGYVEHPQWVMGDGRLIGAQAKLYTASMDAALALMHRALPGWITEARERWVRDGEKVGPATWWRVNLTPPCPGPSAEGDHTLAALAVLSAVLSASITWAGRDPAA